ncbi:CAF1-domain-containing protein [Annulohypoxylon maeteangense]|uniref:CAF1-domain-containing protein n=1 Tax=Annulohypoxylon maeteangense TaxID=1927788 RepID=UPI0020083E33|nr:CAF1-domain-containing protein [Annulohypoxylon maeteangense]KAI0881876.1 CAF1-domain-containing protein [Annulohypoxylon maeteangense]
MEIDKNNFFWMLPCMLHEAQKARFVAIDVEMSGISSAHGHASHINSIQDSYTGIKEAAEKYQVLQVGFTFSHYNEDRSEHIVRTFNCHLSPLFPRSPLSDGLTRYLDRRFCVSARSYSFLQQNKFNLAHSLDNGIHYLSREELRRAEEYCLSRNYSHKGIDPLKLDEESQRFYKYVRKQITGFVTESATPGVGFTIKNPYGGKLNGLQLRLIHQIIREEFPACIAKRVSTGTMAGSISVSLLDEAARLKNDFRQKLDIDEVKRLSGLQILLEALSGGPFATRASREWAQYRNRPPIGLESWGKFNQAFNFQDCEASLSKSRPILVGHNLLQDLAFLYKTFFEPLPPKVDDFINKIHTLFPRIVDTKFMHTKDKHMMETDSTLQELHYYYAKQQFPAFRCDPRFSNGRACAHNAGFDSLMTAVLFLKQAHALFITRKHLNVIEEQCYVATPPSDQEEKSSTNHSNSSTTSWSDTSANTLLDEEEIGTLGALQKWDVLVADESASKQISLTITEKAKASKRDERRSSCSPYRKKDPSPFTIVVILAGENLFSIGTLIINNCLLDFTPHSTKGLAWQKQEL